jgi:hypothetical protein
VQLDDRSRPPIVINQPAQNNKQILHLRGTDVWRRMHVGGCKREHALAFWIWWWREMWWDVRHDVWMSVQRFV